MVVEKGNKIRVEYTGNFESGEVFDASERHGQLLGFDYIENFSISNFS